MINRIFKFRVWDLAKKQWVEDSSSLHCFTDYAITFDGRIVAMEGGISNPTEIKYVNLDHIEYKRPPVVTKAEDRFVIQQFTGYTDKKGKDVYEGDILQNHGDWPTLPFIEIVFECGEFRENHLAY